MEEYYSICCTSPPLYDLDIYGEEPIGICSHCKDNSTFELIQEEE